MSWVVDGIWGLLLASLCVIVVRSHVGESPFWDSHTKVLRGRVSWPIILLQNGAGE